MDEAIGLFRARKLAEATTAFEKLAVAEPTNPEPAFYLGQIALHREDPETAVRWLEKTVDLAPRKSAYQKTLGDAYCLSTAKASLFSKGGFAKKALATLKKAVALDPDNLEARESLIQFYRRAPAIAGGGMDKAYAEAAEIQKRNEVRGALVLVELYAAEKKYPEAFALLDAAIAKKPESKILLYQLGRIAENSGQQLDRGEAALKAYLQSPPQPGEPAPCNAHWRLGTLYEKKGDQAAARHEYETALQLNPGFRQAQEALKKLNP